MPAVMIGLYNVVSVDQGVFFDRAVVQIDIPTKALHFGEQVAMALAIFAHIMKDTWYEDA